MTYFLKETKILKIVLLKINLWNTNGGVNTPTRTQLRKRKRRI
jgi:hypothetical protein